VAGEIGIALLVSGVGLGLRHGIDWDHIAAITDVTGAQPSRVRALAMASLYAAGHAVVVVAIGLIAIWFGSTLPEWVDGYLETVVGATLVMLGIWVFWSMRKNHGHLVLKSRWMLAFQGTRNLWRAAKARVTGRPAAPAVTNATAGYYGPVASTGIGMIHGIGAETGTQALLLAAAAGATSLIAGSFLLAAFAVGLVISNTLIALASLTGIIGAKGSRAVQIVLGTIIGSFSLIVGALFLFQKGGVLPGFFS
jgi:high-affinity nickel-transport protein